MHIHWLQHVPFEGLGMIDSWAARHGHSVSGTRLWADDVLPQADSLDMLVIMGGPMGVNDVEAYPWLVGEKRFIGEVIGYKRVTLGICLGAQLLASACGARVYPHREKEIGWFPVRLDPDAPGWIKEIFPPLCTVFHWHGDTFDIPPEAVLIASSDACKNQGFVVGEHMIGLQVHPEMTGDGVEALVDNCRDELVTTDWVQSEMRILGGGRTHLPAANQIMERLLDHCARTVAAAG